MSPPAPAPVPHHRAIVGVVLAYALGTLLWILLSDLAVGWLAPDAGTVSRLQSIKGALFVAVSAALLYALLRAWAWRLARHARREGQAGERERRALGLLQAVADGSTDAIFAKDTAGRYLLFNREAARLTGVAAEDVIGRDDGALFPPEQAAMIQANDRRVMQQDSAQTFEELLDTAQGPVTFLATKGPLREGGRVVGMFGISRDITEMVRVRRQLQDSEQHWQRLFKANPAPMWVFDRETLRVLAVNDAAQAKYGYTREEFLAMTIADLRPAEQRDALEAYLSDTPTGQPYGYRAAGAWLHRTKAGRVLEVEIASNDLEFEGRQARLVLALDVTEKNRLRAEREAAHRQLADVLARVTDGFAALDEHGRFTYANPRAAALAGAGDPSTMLGRLVWDRFPDAVGSTFHAAYDRARASGQPQRVEAFHPRWGRWHEYRLHPSAGGMTVYFSDITERKQAEAELLERDEALRRSELRYRLASAGGQVWDWDLVSGRTHTATVLWDQLGLAAPVAGQEAQMLRRHMHPEDVPRWEAAVRAHLVRHEPYRLDFRMRHADGRWLWFHTEGQAMWNEEGRAVYMAGTTFEVTAQRQAEQALLASQAELSELARQLLAQERETTHRLAQVLHDRLGQLLASCRLHLDVALAAPAETSAVQRASELVDQSIREVRQVLMALRPPLLETQGLAASLDNELHSGVAAGLGIEATLHATAPAQAARWPDAVAYAAFMIGREAVANALRHAGARSIDVHLDGDGQVLELAITDDGRGIEPEAAEGRPGHLGLVGMRERALAIGGQLTVRSLPAGGTEVRLTWEDRPH